MIGGGTNGQWVRTHNEESAKAFQAEQRSAKDYGHRYGGKLPLILLGVVIAVVLVVFVISRFG